MLTQNQLQTIMPAVPMSKRQAFLPFLQAAMTEFGIEAPPRAAAFLAQLAHESGQFRFMEEIWGPTPAQRRYEPTSTLAATLGNNEAGDGKRFKGRGPIQITGRANYRRFGDLLGIDLVSQPARAALPELAFRIAGLFWSKKGLNDLADRATPDAFREITRRINGGFNGLEERQRFYAVTCAVLAVAEQPRTRDTERDIRDIAGEPEFDRGHEAIRRHLRRKKVARRRAAPRRPKAPSRNKAAVSGKPAATRRKKPAKKARRTSRKKR